MKEKKEEKKTEKSAKIEPTNFSFIKKIAGLRDEILIKKTKIKEGEEEKIANTIVVANDPFSYMVQVTQKKEVFTDDAFGIRDVKSFLKTVGTSEYNQMKETDNDLEFSSDKKKIVYRKVEARDIPEYSLPKFDKEGYVSISLTANEIKEIVAGLKNDISDYASFILDKDNKLKMKIGLLVTENYYEQDIKTVERKESSEIKFMTKLDFFQRFFNTLEDIESNQVVIFLKNDNPFIGVEKNSILAAKTFIASIVNEEILNDDAKEDKDEE